MMPPGEEDIKTPVEGPMRTELIETLFNLWKTSSQSLWTNPFQSAQAVTEEQQGRVLGLVLFMIRSVTLMIECTCTPPFLSADGLGGQIATINHLLSASLQATGESP